MFFELARPLGENVMADCHASISEQTIGDAASCAWELVRSSVQAVVQHPGGATAQDWLVGVASVLAALFLLSFVLRLLLPRRRL